MARGKVITTHLRTGDPNGIRTVFISNKICEMIVFPKSEFEMVSKMEESSRPALYILNIWSARPLTWLRIAHSMV